MAIICKHPRIRRITVRSRWLGYERRPGRVVIEGGGGGGWSYRNQRSRRANQGLSELPGNPPALNTGRSRWPPKPSTESLIWDKKLRNQRGFVEGDAKTLAPDPGSLELPDRFRE